MLLIDYMGGSSDLPTNAQSYAQWRKEATVVVVIITLAASAVFVVRIDFIL